MPIAPPHPVCRLSQDDFAAMSYEVLGCVFEIHNEFGRFFDEKIYKRELACRLPQVEIEFPISIAHDTFSTTYYVDALVGNGGAFEFKAVETLAPEHRRQLYNYLLLLDLSHGKLVNLRSESVQHEFVNALLRPEQRHAFAVCADRWDSTVPGAEVVADWIASILRDWGTGLALELYLSAITHFLGGEDSVLGEVAVHGSRQNLGVQRMRLAAPRVAFRITALESNLRNFEQHARRLLSHVDLQAILRVNIGLEQVSLVTVQ